MSIIQFWSIKFIHSKYGTCRAFKGLPRWIRGKESTCNAGDMSLIPGSGRFPGEGNGNPLQYFCLENPMDGEAWWATVHGVAKSRTWLHFHFHAQYTGKSHKKVHAALEFFTLSRWRTSRKINLHNKQNFKKYIYLYILPREKDHHSEGIYIKSKGFFWWWASRKEKDWIDRRFRVEVHVWTS